MMSTGDIYIQGMEITMLGGTTNSQSTDTAADLGGTTNSQSTDTAADLGGTTNNQGTDTAADLGGTTNNQGTGSVTNLGGTAKSSAPSQGCVGTAPNCTDSITDTANVFGHNNGSADPLLSGSAEYFTFVSSGPLNIVNTEPIPEPPGLALLAPALLGFVLWGGVGATKCRENTRSQQCYRRVRALLFLRTLSFATRASGAERGSRTDGLRHGRGGIRASAGNTIWPECRRRRPG
jgi:hypothetical protein